MELYKKYRPQTLEDIQGNKATVTSLLAALNKHDPPQAFLFYGPTACGKTTLARIVAREVGAVGSDYKEVDSADFRGIDSIREIRKQSHYQALEGKRKVFLLDECHKLSNDAMNALLKALEDTPKNVVYILCTTDPQKLIKPILGRCSQFQVAPLNSQDMLTLLRRVTHAEGETVSREVYQQITESSEGLPRNALQILEQILGVAEEDRLGMAQRVAEVRAESIELARALVSRVGWKKVAEILTRLKASEEDPEGIRRLVCGYCQSILLKGKEDSMLGTILEEFIDPFYNTPWPQLTLACFSVVCGG